MSGRFSNGPAFTFAKGRVDGRCLLAAPHAGRRYPADLEKRLRVEPAELRRLEDRHADMLLGEAAKRGFPTIVAHVPRAIIDLNRALHDFDPAMVEEAELGRLAPRGIRAGRTLGARTRGGLGLVPRRLYGCGELWAHRLSADELDERIDHIYEPYHAAIAAEMDAMAARHGRAVLLDIHSMPPLSGQAGKPPPDIVIGDLHGASADMVMVNTLADIARSAGLKVARNHPYAGGYVLRRHGRTRRGRHAVQVEIDRRLYLDDTLGEPGPGLAAMARLVADMASAVHSAGGEADWPAAAE